MKKSKKLLLLFLVGAIMLPSTGCGCEHDFSEWTVKTKSTCTEKGVEIRICDLCEEEETRDIELVAHRYSQWSVKKEATCTEKGIKIQKCVVCDAESEEHPIPTKNHSFDEGVMKTAATCTEKGSKEVTCKNCGTKEIKEVAPAGHNYGEWKVTLEATCDKTGEKERTCSICKELEKGVEEANGHTYGEWETVTAATCSAEGARKRICSTCNFTDNSTSPKIGHNYVFGICSMCGITDPDFDAIYISPDNMFMNLYDENDIKLNVKEYYHSYQSVLYVFKFYYENNTNERVIVGFRDVIIDGITISDFKYESLEAGHKGIGSVQFPYDDLVDLGMTDWSCIEANLEIYKGGLGEQCIIYNKPIIIEKACWYQ